MKRRSRTYTDHTINQQQPLDSGDVKQCIYLHAKMNILTYIIDNKIYGREFIAVSKKCCYLCEFYIDFAQIQGYNIIVSGNHKKIYNQFPEIYTNQIIRQKLEHYTRSLPVGPDSGRNSPDLNNSDSRYMDASF
ncbi:13126_t:CDS:2 [Funneliformis mosseae]|uniref:13126_t:CDS:1 n=1 Tax=Funneliformis mosseae TaxID=27381 RepID=A0A9N9EI26_FUNMO|nr:13126_t:CDS:2 [Funneliformis mosseae]